MRSKVKIGGKHVLGEFARTPNGFDLAYEFGGDGCRLLYDGVTLTHKKGGEIPVEIDFREGEETVCVIGDKNLAGSVNVVTRALTIKDCGGEIVVSVDYLFGGDRSAIDISVIPEDENFE